MPIDNIVLRPVEGPQEYHAAEAIQRAAWPSDDAIEVIPLAFMLTAQKNGGLVLGAFLEGEMIAFAFSILGRSPDKQWKHSSHMLAVLPQHRASGVGEQLKWAQRDFVLQQGLDLITWTVDPLEGPNASLNFGKLGVVCNRYLRNLYGDMQDGLNLGLPSDRLEVDWQIGSPRVASFRKEPEKPRRTAEKDVAAAFALNALDWNEKFPTPADPILDADEPLLAISVPPSIQAIKAHSMDLAAEWRLHTRSIFEAYFIAGYSATDFLSRPTDLGRQNTYLLRKS
jgi:predicted GNAT superfamily acetyltransferase